MGKLAAKDLEKVLRCIKKDPRVIIPPRLGFDSGVHTINDKCMVVSTDPCIGVPREWFGWLLVHYAASDVALFGAKPEFCAVNLLGPPLTKPRTFQSIMEQTCQAADELQMAIVTGHTGTYDGLSTPIGVCTAYGTVDRTGLITPGGAEHGDYIFCTKRIGLEVVVNLALTRKVLAEKILGVQRTQEIKGLVPMQSSVKDALLLAATNGVHAMHDATEGGLTAALNEMAQASNVGFTIEKGKLPILKEVKKLQDHFKLSEEQVLAVSSTGTIVAAVDPMKKDVVEAVLSSNDIQFSNLGSFTKNKRRILIKNGKKESFPIWANDPYEIILSGKE
jgi:hydrogenase expression/formation protein HypE